MLSMMATGHPETGRKSPPVMALAPPLISNRTARAVVMHELNRGHLPLPQNDGGYEGDDDGEVEGRQYGRHV